jgi:oxygen-independent coproporphyrinogen-3 oxidase
VTIEANPGVLSLGKLRLLRDLGINRLSLGAQSFDDRLLSVLGRRHRAEHTRHAVRAAHEAGFANLSLDLIYGLPGQTTPDLAGDLQEALALEPEHLSLYELTLGPDTPFGRRYKKGRPPLPDEAAMEAMEQAAYHTLEQAGLHRYEVSNFSRPGRECRHNQDVWQGGDYLALGPGAHGHLQGLRWAWQPDAQAYINGITENHPPYQFREQLTPAQRALELFMLGLRTSRGVDLTQVGQLLGVPAEQAHGPALAEIQARDWARLNDKWLIPTHQGLAMADAAAGLFV